MFLTYVDLLLQSYTEPYLYQKNTELGRSPFAQHPRCGYVECHLASKQKVSETETGFQIRALAGGV
ncbi:hypothetical protein BOTCAL_0487g00030 [Botryotinia calthae]|uniref:Uncharacterized protein n=1 Tax=Botryotinia calthae TaxID=38488 RepID=A0A4Y8CNZ8_9HELO|nr:hypothetical protein BOTCAL_0487g00030 [Botryotinia calthae]